MLKLLIVVNTLQRKRGILGQIRLCCEIKWEKFSLFIKANWTYGTALAIERVNMHWNWIHVDLKYDDDLEVERQSAYWGGLTQAIWLLSGLGWIMLWSICERSLEAVQHNEPNRYTWWGRKILCMDTREQ